ncbi:MAG TPA: dTDP-4-amino-4,6-dideoxygalactose transaminase [Lachnospiraceae bacterium]
MIEFNKAPFLGSELEFVKEAMENHKLCGDGPFTKRCHQWFQKHLPVNHALLTTSCTHALEMAAILANISPGDEVILPSYTFVSTGDAFVQRGAKLVFVDIRPDTMNIDENLIEAAITPKTKAIVPVHYAGVSCEMDKILAIAKAHHLKVIEDAAQGFDATYKGQALGTIGDFGCFSFHETKNLSMGEGGALLFQDSSILEKAEILREKGTNRSKFFRGQIDKYTWVDYGSSYLPSDINAAYLYGQLEKADEIQGRRREIFSRYQDGLADLAKSEKLRLPVIPKECKANAHMFYIKLKDLEERSRLISFLKERDILSVFHYIPLHISPAGQKYGRFHGQDCFTSKESERLLRLPLHYHLTNEEQDKVITSVYDFFKKR